MFARSRTEAMNEAGDQEKKLNFARLTAFGGQLSVSVAVSLHIYHMPEAEA